MYKENERFENVSAVVFEGPDCCGKSTQVDKFIEKAAKIDQHDVIIKLHFPFDSLGYDLLKNNYNDLVNTIYSKEYMQEINDLKLSELSRILLENIDLNHFDKIFVIRILKNLFFGLFNVVTKSNFSITYNNEMTPIQLIKNKNCEIWFNGCKIDKNNDIEVLRMYFEQTVKPNVLLVFDRFIISGMVYNLHLPSSMSNNKLFEKITDSLSVAQIHHTESEIDILNSIDILVDGPFIESQKSLLLKSRGSRNQRIILSRESFITGKLTICEEVMKGERDIHERRKK